MVVLGMPWDIVAWLGIFPRLGRWILRSFRRHPELWIPVVFAVLKSFGVTVRTGEVGVRFFCGRASGELGPGFHWLIPGLHSVRKVHVRSTSVDLGSQRIATPDGLVYRVDVNAIYHVEDATTSEVQINRLRQGVLNVFPVAVQETLWRKTRAELSAPEGLDKELEEVLQSKVARWGVVIEQAGFQAIAPTRQSMRVTQIAPQAEERRRMYGILRGAGMGEERALGLLGARRMLLASSTVRRRRALSALRRRARALAPRRDLRARRAAQKPIVVRLEI